MFRERGANCGCRGECGIIMSMSGKSMDMIDYVVLCVNEFAKTHGLAYRDSFGYLYKNKGLEFLMDFFPQESTLSLQVALDDLKTVCANNGGVLT